MIPDLLLPNALYREGMPVLTPIYNEPLPFLQCLPLGIERTTGDPFSFCTRLVTFRFLLIAVPFSKSINMPLQIYIGGQFYDKENAKISVYDHGLLYGDGVFEGMRSYSGKVFRMKEHLDRLYESARQSV